MRAAGEDLTRSSTISSQVTANYEAVEHGVSRHESAGTSQQVSQPDRQREREPARSTQQDIRKRKKREGNGEECGGGWELGERGLICCHMVRAVKGGREACGAGREGKGG